MIMSKQIEVIEVGPRDGFQSVKCMSTILIGVVLMVYHSVCRLFYSYETPAAAAEE